MCGRILVQVDGQAYFEALAQGVPELNLAPDRFQALGRESQTREVNPTQEVIIHHRVDGEILPERAFWTLVPPWVRDKSKVVVSRVGQERLQAPPRTHFNSRADTLLGSAGWRGLLRRNRCVLYLDGFFEWSDPEMLDGRPKMAGRYQLTEGRLMPVAGIWSPILVEGRRVLTCSIVTTKPNDLLESLPHHRLPAVLLGKDLGRWLDANESEFGEVLHSTNDTEFESMVVPAGRFRELVAEEKA
jgi:putative SOS response-associated peptidase YedK